MSTLPPGQPLGLGPHWAGCVVVLPYCLLASAGDTFLYSPLSRGLGVALCQRGLTCPESLSVVDRGYVPLDLQAPGVTLSFFS